MAMTDDFDMESQYDLQRKAHETMRKNRMEFVLNMESLLILNTNIISKRLHISTRQKIQAIYDKQGNFYANCELMDNLCRFDTGGEDLLKAFREIKFESSLATLLREALTPHSARINNTKAPAAALHNPALSLSSVSTPPLSSVSTPPLSSLDYLQKDIKLLTAVQETGLPRVDPPPHPVRQKENSLTKVAQSSENQFTELTSAQHQVVSSDAISTSCNITKGKETIQGNPFHINVNQSINGKEETNKKLQTFIQSEDSSSITEDEISSSSSSEMSDSFYISDSDIRQAFYQSNDNIHEIETLKYDDEVNVNVQVVPQYAQNHENNLNSQTQLKQVQNQDSVTDYKEDGCGACLKSENAIEVYQKKDETKDDSLSSQTFRKEIRHDGFEQNTASIAQYCDTPSNLIDVHTPKNTIKEEGPCCGVQIDNAEESDIQRYDEIDVNETTEGEGATVREDIFQTTTNQYDSNSVAPISRLQSCPLMGTHDSLETNNNSERDAAFSRSLSLPSRGNTFIIFNNVLNKREPSACKGIAGNL